MLPLSSCITPINALDFEVCHENFIYKTGDCIFIRSKKTRIIEADRWEHYKSSEFIISKADFIKLKAAIIMGEEPDVIVPKPSKENSDVLDEFYDDEDYY